MHRNHFQCLCFPFFSEAIKKSKMFEHAVVQAAFCYIHIYYYPYLSSCIYKANYYFIYMPVCISPYMCATEWGRTAFTLLVSKSPACHVYHACGLQLHACWLAVPVLYLFIIMNPQQHREIVRQQKELNESTSQLHEPGL